MICPHCASTIIWRNEDGDPNCLCGYVFVADAEVAYSLAMRTAQPRGGSHSVQHRVSAEQKAIDRRRRRREHYARQKAAQ